VNPSFPTSGRIARATAHSQRHPRATPPPPKSPKYAPIGGIGRIGRFAHDLGMPDIDVMPTDLEVLVAPRVRLPNSPDAHSMLVRMISIASSAMLLAREVTPQPEKRS
jgi:hypothetical protein